MQTRPHIAHTQGISAIQNWRPIAFFPHLSVVSYHWQGMKESSLPTIGLDTTYRKITERGWGSIKLNVEFLLHDVSK